MNIYRIDKTRTILNFDFWWNYYSKFLGYPASCCHSYHSRACSFQELVYIESIRYLIKESQRDIYAKAKKGKLGPVMPKLFDAFQVKKGSSFYDIPLAC